MGAAFAEADVSGIVRWSGTRRRRILVVEIRRIENGEARQLSRARVR
jgi:hypothetical protein